MSPLRLLLSFPLVLTLMSCAGGEPAEADPDLDPPGAALPDPAPEWVNTTAVYSCMTPAGNSFNLTTTNLNQKPGELALWLPPRFDRPYQVLTEVEGESPGLLYTGDGISLSLREGTAALSVDDLEFRSCPLDRRASVWEHAKLSGVDFRATGNEPGWHLEIGHDLEARAGKRIRFVYDYGQHEAVFHAPDPSVDRSARRTTYNGVNGELTIVVEILGESCRDSMSGEEFEATVRIEFRGRSYGGCGRALH